MDWRQFTASAIASLAWPTVIIVLLIVLRKHVGSLATRIEELTLPGGAKARFVKELEGLRKTTELIPIATRASRGNVRSKEGQLLANDELQMLQLAARSPEAAVLEGYREIEEVIEEKAANLPPELQRRNPQQLIETLVAGGFLDSDSRALFFRLRNTRNTAAHVGKRAGITAGEAIEFREHAKFFSEILGQAISKFLKTEHEAEGRRPSVGPHEG